MSRKQRLFFTLALVIFSLIAVSLATAFASPGGVSTLGDFVWFDENGNGVKDESPEWGNSGIDGVLVNLYLDDGDAVFEPGTDDPLEKSTTTGDNPGTTEVEHGWYDFTEVGDHLGWWVEIADSNFDHGGPLEGYVYTGDLANNAYNGPEPRFVYIPDTLTDYNDADFGYTLKNEVAIGNFVWHDSNNNAMHDAGESGIDGVTVTLYRDTNGNGVCEPGVDALVETTTTSGGGYYQFVGLIPSDGADPTTFYCVALTKADLTGAGFTQSSTGGDHNPDIGDHGAANGDDGLPSGNYVISQPFAATKGGQTTADVDDAIGYADSSSYMTVDFGFLTDGDVRSGAPNAVRLTMFTGRGGGFLPGLSWMFFGLVGLGAFVWRRRN